MGNAEQGVCVVRIGHAALGEPFLDGVRGLGVLADAEKQLAHGNHLIAGLGRRQRLVRRRQLLAVGVGRRTHSLQFGLGTGLRLTLEHARRQAPLEHPRGLGRESAGHQRHGHLRVLLRLVERIRIGHQAIQHPQVPLGLGLVQLVGEQVLPVLLLRVVTHQRLQRAHRCGAVLEFIAAAQPDHQQLLVGLRRSCGQLLHRRLGTRKIVLQVLGVRHHRADVRAARNGRDVLLAVLDGLRVVLELVVELRHRLVALRKVRLRHEAGRDGSLERRLGARIVLGLDPREPAELVHHERFIRCLRLDRRGLVDVRDRLGPFLLGHGLLGRPQRLGHFRAELLPLGSDRGGGRKQGTGDTHYACGGHGRHQNQVRFLHAGPRAPVRGRKNPYSIAKCRSRDPDRRVSCTLVADAGPCAAGRAPMALVGSAIRPL